MKKHLLLFVLVLGSIGAMAQAFGWTELGDSNALKANGTILSICTDAAGQVYAAGDFTNASGKHYVAMWNGIRWSELGNYDNGLNESYPIPSICSDGFYIYAISSLNSQENYVAKYLSISWESMPSLTTMGINHYPIILNSICTDDLGNVYAGGRLLRDSVQPPPNNHDTILCEYAAKWDKGASTWIKLLYYTYFVWQTGGGDVLTMCTGGADNVYAAGFIFTSPDSSSGVAGGYQVVNWDGTNFSLVGGALNGINADMPINSICTAALGHVYAVGCFSNASISPVAVWNGIEWSKLGNFPNNQFNIGCWTSVCTDGFGNVYTEADIDHPYPTGSYLTVAKWDGMGWSELGNSINPFNPNGSILTLCTDATGNVYAAGNFTNSAGYYYVAKCAKIDQIKWIRLNSHTSNKLNSINFTNPNTVDPAGQNQNVGYVAGSGGTILKTTNSGSNWTSLSSGTSNSLNSIFFLNANYGYAVGAAGIILKTINGGTNWVSQNSGINNQLNSVYFTDTATGYAVGVAGTILKTINGGTNWTAVNSGTDTQLNSIYFTDSNHGYIVGVSGTILKTTNGGGNWLAISSGTINTLHSVKFIDDTMGFAVGDSCTIIKTTDGGTTWTAHNVPVSMFLTSVYFIDSDTGYAAGANGAILKTTNGGTNWMVQNSGISQNLSSICFTAPNAGYAVGDSGTIIGTTTGGIGRINNLSSKDKPIKIYPNPSFDKVMVETAEIPAKGLLSVLNLNGMELIRQQVSAPRTVVNVNSLPSGVYFIKLQNEKTVQVGKFIKN